MTKVVRTLTLAGVLFVAVSLHAAPVEYVRVCPDDGSGWSYIPGTDICIDVRSGETRSETEGGTWTAHAGRLPGNWVASPRADCLLGRVVKVATFTRADLNLNAYSRYETAPVPLVLGPREFISKAVRGRNGVLGVRAARPSLKTGIAGFSAPFMIVERTAAP